MTTLDNLLLDHNLMTYEEFAVSYLNNLDEGDYYDIYQENMAAPELFYMEFIDDIVNINRKGILEIYDLFNDDFNPRHTFFKINIYGYISSTDDMREECPADELADYVDLYDKYIEYIEENAGEEVAEQVAGLMV